MIRKTNLFLISVFEVALIVFVAAFTAYAQSCNKCKKLDGYIPPDKIAPMIYKMVGKMNPGDKDKSDDVKIQKQRGVIETGTFPKFVNGNKCPEIDSEKWAIDYSKKRPWAALHKGIDIPQPKGTPVYASASGTVIGKFKNKNNRKGIEVMLRHTPDDTGLPFYTYTQYTHLLEMSPLKIGAKVKVGDEIAKIWNTGKMGKRTRRDALHFAVLYSNSPKWSNDGRIIAPKDSYWMDPVVFFSNNGPYDSLSVKNRSKSDKAITTAHILKNGEFVPENALRIWPFACD